MPVPKKISRFGACSGFLEVKNRPWSVAHTRIPDIRKFHKISCVGNIEDCVDDPLFSEHTDRKMYGCMDETITVIFQIREEVGFKGHSQHFTL